MNRMLTLLVTSLRRFFSLVPSSFLLFLLFYSLLRNTNITTHTQGSVPVYLGFMVWSGGGSAGLFGGWSVVAWAVALLGAAGGLLVALSIKYGDAILKTLATTAAIILSSVLDWYLLDGPLTPIMMIAGVQVILSICNYTFDATPETALSSVAMMEAPGKEMSKDSDRPIRHNDEEIALIEQQPQRRTESSS